jgi:micrococcal nuclease
MTITANYDFPGLKARGRAIKVIDGDTLDLELDIGFHLTFKSRFRILGIDTPELNSKDVLERAKAIEAKDMLMRMVMPNGVELTKWPLMVTVNKDPDNFGRWLAEIHLYNDDIEAIPIDVGTKLIGLGLAVPYKR